MKNLKLFEEFGDSIDKYLDIYEEITISIKYLIKNSNIQLKFGKCSVSLINGISIIIYTKDEKLTDYINNIMKFNKDIIQNLDGLTINIDDDIFDGYDFQKFLFEYIPQHIVDFIKIYKIDNKIKKEYEYIFGSEELGLI